MRNHPGEGRSTSGGRRWASFLISSCLLGLCSGCASVYANIGRPGAVTNGQEPACASELNAAFSYIFRRYDETPDTTDRLAKGATLLVGEDEIGVRPFVMQSRKVTYTFELRRIGDRCWLAADADVTRFDTRPKQVELHACSCSSD
jgi:hypothetical protein